MSFYNTIGIKISAKYPQTSHD